MDNDLKYYVEELMGNGYAINNGICDGKGSYAIFMVSHK